ncbi:hypothetical protein CCH79_00009688 [Gambusia affinis]|uniref:Uncharacterized protein n=1 Tax=Gambusia affinis TaxID=33528 RepID=A0A315WE52_GAMAF|nr:hypothetical protein CCH79_00009688 [Gambusia affinis]
MLSLRRCSPPDSVGVGRFPHTGEFVTTFEKQQRMPCTIVHFLLPGAVSGPLGIQTAPEFSSTETCSDDGSESRLHGCAWLRLQLGLKDSNQSIKNIQSVSNRSEMCSSSVCRKISNSWLSTGWFTMTIALELCDRINVFGMVAPDFCREPQHQSVPYHYYEPRGPDECAMYISHERGKRGSHHRFITEKRAFANWARTFDIHFFQPDWSPPPLPDNRTLPGTAAAAAAMVLQNTRVKLRRCASRMTDRRGTVAGMFSLTGSLLLALHTMFSHQLGKKD